MYVYFARGTDPRPLTPGENVAGLRIWGAGGWPSVSAPGKEEGNRRGGAEMRDACNIATRC